MRLEEAIALARRFHDGAVDKGGRPYIEHPLRVMARVSTDQEKLAAVLHDLLEDTELSATDLVAAGCPARVVQAVDALTRRPDETYDDFIEGVLTDPVARSVKLADIADNLDPDRLAQLDPDQASALRAKYQRALARLQAAPAADDPSPSPFAVGEPDPDPDAPYARFDCATCAHPAGRVELGGGASEAATLVVTSPLGRGSFRLEGTPRQEAGAAVSSADLSALYRLDPEFAPFWCPRCELSYCDRHWTREVVVEDGFYDCTYGTCPAGHRRILDD